MLFSHADAVILATILETRINLARHSHMTAFRWHAVSSHPPNPARAIIEFVDAGPKRPVAISDCADELDDGTGRIWVMTTHGVPSKGAHVGVSGQVYTGLQ